MTPTPFRKMHGIGNDFVVLDGRAQKIDLSVAQARTLADRRWGVGCDEILIIEGPKDGGDAFMGVRNADGSVAENCGNGARCVADVLMNESGKTKVVLETLGGPITATRAAKGLVSVDMGPARLKWNEIPLAEDCDTLHVPVTEGPLRDPVAVSMGNPHAVFFVPDAETVALETLGPKLEHNAMFPQRANIEVVHAQSRTHLRMRVWERGSGITMACGTGACATAVAAIRRGMSERTVKVMLDGGDLEIEWRESDGHVIMTGPATHSFSGTWNWPT